MSDSNRKRLQKIKDFHDEQDARKKVNFQVNTTRELLLSFTDALKAARTQRLSYGISIYELCKRVNEYSSGNITVDFLEKFEKFIEDRDLKELIGELDLSDINNTLMVLCWIYIYTSSFPSDGKNWEPTVVGQSL